MFVAGVMWNYIPFIRNGARIKGMEPGAKSFFLGPVLTTDSTRCIETELRESKRLQEETAASSV